MGKSQVAGEGPLADLGVRSWELSRQCLAEQPSAGSLGSLGSLGLAALLLL